MRLPGKQRVQRSGKSGSVGEILDDIVDLGESPSSSGSKRRKLTVSHGGRQRRGVCVCVCACVRACV